MAIEIFTVEEKKNKPSAVGGNIILGGRLLLTAVADRPREPEYVPMAVAVSLTDENLERVGLRYA